VGRDVDVTVRMGIGVNVRVGVCVKVSVEGRLVDVSATIGEEGAVGLPLVELQALVMRITKTSTYKLLVFIFLLY